MSEREELIRKVREAAEAIGTPVLTRAQFARHSGVSPNRIYQHFDGWRHVCELAGLVANMQNVRLNDDQVFRAMRDAFLQLGRVGTRTQFAKHFQFSVEATKRRWGGWRNVLVAFRRWVEANDPTFIYLSQLPMERTAAPSISRDGHDTAIATEQWKSRGGRSFGEVVNFRGLLHSPVNEQGVVFLFGMVAQELGYVVEIVTTGFPDCEAKRRISKGRWERVRIEFEYRSRNFLDHGHPTEGCDVIVCWHHDWPDCPVEVLDLKSAIRRLPTTYQG